MNDELLILRQGRVQFDGGHIVDKAILERDQRVFGMQPSGAAMTLKIHDSRKRLILLWGRARKNQAGYATGPNTQAFHTDRTNISEPGFKPTNRSPRNSNCINPRTAKPAHLCVMLAAHER